MGISIEEMKEQIKEYTKKQKAQFKGVEEPWETTTLYHGTTSRQLNSILKNGLTPRKVTQINNFSEVPSNEELVYLTTKWHYWYAYNANQESLLREIGKERFEKAEHFADLWNETSDFPMYVICDVPVELLTLDEDVVYQNFIKRGLREGTITSPKDISVNMCLEQGTVASLDTISLEYISEIIILGNEDYRNYLLEGQYGGDARGWFRGFGLGETDRFSLSLLELTEFRKGNEIIEVGDSPEENEPVKKIEVGENGLTIIR